MVVHGGAGKHTAFIKANASNIRAGLTKAVALGHEILKNGGSALDAVEEAVKYLEDDPLFNAGRGSCLNALGEVEMDASIMDGKELDAGAVSMVRGIKNPISLARVIMHKTQHVFLSGYGAYEIAQLEGLSLEEPEYFITPHQYQNYLRLNNKETFQDILQKPDTGTVGAVALDAYGNLASGTSTGGTSNCLPGRIGDSCIIGGGCYANNKNCAISGTGHGEVLITGVVGNTIALFSELKKISLQEASDYVIHNLNQHSSRENWSHWR